MRLSELIRHTASWTGVPEAQVNTVARALRPAGLLSSAGKDPRGAEMTVDDKVNLLLGTCGVEIANRAAEYVRVWRRSFRSSVTPVSGLNFAFLEAGNVRDLIVNLIEKDLNGGPLSKWLAEADSALGKSVGRNTALNHTVTLDFYVDTFALELIVTRNQFEIALSRKVVRVTSDPISVRFAPPPPPLDIPIPPRLSDSYKATSDLIRRLHETNLVGWGACLRDE